MRAYGQNDAAMMRRIATRVEDILEAAKLRESKGQSLALDIDARFRLEDMGAIQFQLASAILEEMGGLRQEEVVSELLSLGLASVLRSAAAVASQNGVRTPLSLSEPMPGLEEGDLLTDAFDDDESDYGLLSHPVVSRGQRILN